MCLDWRKLLINCSICKFAVGYEWRLLRYLEANEAGAAQIREDYTDVVRWAARGNVYYPGTRGGDDYLCPTEQVGAVFDRLRRGRWQRRVAAVILISPPTGTVF